MDEILNFIESVSECSPSYSSTKRRVILDLSFPKGSAVIEGILKEFYLESKISLTFPRVDDLVEIIKGKGRQCLFFFKRDLKRAYRQIAVDPGDVSLLGYNFKHIYYFDKFISIGLRSVAYICQMVTNAVRFMCTLLSIAVVN